VVVAWQCSQRLVELADEQTAVGVDAVPPSAAATSFRQMVLPHATACYRTAGEVLLSHGCTLLYTTPLTQHVGDSTSNSCVEALSVSSRIRPSLAATAQRRASVKASCVVQLVWRSGCMEAWLCASKSTPPKVINQQALHGCEYTETRRLTNTMWRDENESHHGSGRTDSVCDDAQTPVDEE
jgi:hypothetical protein